MSIDPIGGGGVGDISQKSSGNAPHFDPKAIKAFDGEIANHTPKLAGEEIKVAQAAIIPGAGIFGPPVPPEAIPGTPQNKALTEKTVGAIHGIAKTIQDPAGWSTVENRLDYLGEQIGEGNVGAGVDHLFLGKPFPAEVDTGSGGAASDAGAGEAGWPVQLNDWSTAFGDGEGPTERSVPGTVPGLTPEELRSAAQEFDFTQPGLVPPEMPDTNLEGYSTPKFDFTQPGFVPPEMPDTNLEGYAAPEFDFTQPGFVPPEMPIDTTKVESSSAPELYALINGQKVTPERVNKELYYGTGRMTWDDVVANGGLPERGTNRDLADHANQAENQGAEASAFRGTTLMLMTPTGQGAIAWADEGELVLKIDGYKIPAYDVNRLLEGQRQMPDGNYRGNIFSGEQEYAIHARVPLEAIKEYSYVERLRNGTLRVKEFIENPYYAK